MAFQTTTRVSSAAARRSRPCFACSTIIRSITTRDSASDVASVRSRVDRQVTDATALDAGELASLIARHPVALRKIVVETARADARTRGAIVRILLGERAGLRRMLDRGKAHTAFVQAMWAVSPALTHAVADDLTLATELLTELARELRGNKLLAATVMGEMELAS
jgi:hypothetical protein